MPRADKSTSGKEGNGAGSGCGPPDDPRHHGGSRALHRDEAESKRLAWANGAPPKETVHGIHLSDTHEMREVEPEQHERWYRSI